jgi:hypothetical protein
MTDTLREAAQMALDALEYAEQNHGGDDCYFDAIEALRAALAQPEQEPVAWVYQHKDTGLTMCVLVQQVESGFEKNNPRWQKSTPLYTAPPQREWCQCKDAPNDCTYEKNCRVPQIDAAFKRIEWQGLTDDEITRLRHLYDPTAHWSLVAFAHAIEAKLKEKNS